MASFCKKIVELRIFTSAGGTRHSIDKLEDMGLIIKKAQKSKGKLISLNSEVGIVQDSITYNIVHGLD